MPVRKQRDDAAPTSDVEKRSTHADNESTGNRVGRISAICLQRVPAAGVQRLVGAASSLVAWGNTEPN